MYILPLLLNLTIVHLTEQSLEKEHLPRTLGRLTCRPSCTSHMAECLLLWPSELSGSDGSLLIEKQQQ